MKQSVANQKPGIISRQRKEEIEERRKASNVKAVWRKWRRTKRSANAKKLCKAGVGENRNAHQPSLMTRRMKRKLAAESSGSVRKANKAAKMARKAKRASTA